MRYFKLTVAYDGSAYCGWQFQLNGPSVQGALETAWQQLTQESLRISASGRTDSGVHAEGQVCSLRSPTSLPPPRILAGLNAFLPEDIRVSAVQIMPREFHAIQDAQGKTYRYQIQSGPVRHVLGRHTWWYVPPKLDVSAMQQGALRLEGTHDFAAFQTMGSPRRSTVRTIRKLTVDSQQTGPYQWLSIHVTADGFLYNMVRCIAGTLAEVGKGRQPAEWVTDVLMSQRREQAGATAPPQGLCLMQVDYPPEFM